MNRNEVGLAARLRRAKNGNDGLSIRLFGAGKSPCQNISTECNRSICRHARRSLKRRLPKIAPKNRSSSGEVAEMLERVKGIEPSPEAWEAILRPLISLPFSGNQNDFSILEFPGGSLSFPGFPIVCT
jgi:hypothetical protein